MLYSNLTHSSLVLSSKMAFYSTFCAFLSKNVIISLASLDVLRLRILTHIRFLSLPFSLTHTYTHTHTHTCTNTSICTYTNYFYLPSLRAQYIIRLLNKVHQCKILLVNQDWRFHIQMSTGEHRLCVRPYWSSSAQDFFYNLF